MAGSLKAGVAAMPEDRSGAIVLLGDMPLVKISTIDAMVERFGREDRMPDAVIPIHEGVPGNPVLLGRTLFAAIMRLEGDKGARALLAEPDRMILSLPVEDEGVVIDVDTTEMLRRLKGRA